MTYDQAIHAGYADQVAAVNQLPCDFSQRTDWPGKEPGLIEFTASHRWVDPQGDEWIITAYYYQDEDDLPQDGDLASLDWHAVNYEVA